ncbi:hypothetical protein, partial [Vibrio coralliirubri]|uniref:hypothetical protein n=1 Tax=Vibrio coralliirubri TaxID=1516159 RepID=UPI001EE3C750
MNDLARLVICSSGLVFRKLRVVLERHGYKDTFRKRQSSETKKANSMSWLFDFPIKENMVEGDGF